MSNENNVNKEIPVQSIMYVFGTDVTTMSKEQLLASLGKLEAQKKEYTEYKTKSKYIDTQIKSIDESIKQVVELLDAE